MWAHKSLFCKILTWVQINEVAGINYNDNWEHSLAALLYMFYVHTIRNMSLRWKWQVWKKVDGDIVES